MTTRCNPRRNRNAPKRFEDEKFVSGAIDRYQHCYEANKSWKYDNINGHENYYNNSRGHKFTTIEWNDRGKYRVQLRDFSESLLEFSSIWRDMGLVLPGALVSRIGEYLRISDVDKALVMDDDEFIVNDDDDELEEAQSRKWCCSGLSIESESEDEWNSDDDSESEDEWQCSDDDDY